MKERERLKEREFRGGFEVIIHRSSQLTSVGKEKERKKVIIARLWMLEGLSFCPGLS